MASRGMTTLNPKLTQSRVAFGMATLVDTPAITTVLAPRLRSSVGTSVPFTGDRPPMRVEKRSLSAASMPSISSVPSLPGVIGPGPSCLAFAAPWKSGALVLAPRRSSRVAAMQCRTPQPAARPVVTSRLTFPTSPVASADSASAGSRLRWPMTPFWHSWVRTTVDSGTTSSASFMAVPYRYPSRAAASARSARRVFTMLATMAPATMATITPSDATVGKCHQCDTIILIPTNTRIAPSAWAR